MTSWPVLSTPSPAYLSDRDGAAKWHEQVVWAVFQYGFEVSGMDDVPRGKPSVDRLCPVCDCGFAAGETCWNCPPSEGGAA